MQNNYLQSPHCFCRFYSSLAPIHSNPTLFHLRFSQMFDAQPNVPPPFTGDDTF